MFNWNEIVFEIVGTINIAIIYWWTKTVGCQYENTTINVHMLLISICLLPRIQLALIGSDCTFKPLYCQRKLHLFPSHNKVWKVVLVYMVMQIKFALFFFFFQNTVFPTYELSNLWQVLYINSSFKGITQKSTHPFTKINNSTINAISLLFLLGTSRNKTFSKGVATYLQSKDNYKSSGFTVSSRSQWCNTYTKALQWRNILEKKRMHMKQKWNYIHDFSHWSIIIIIFICSVALFSKTSTGIQISLKKQSKEK